MGGLNKYNQKVETPLLTIIDYLIIFLVFMASALCESSAEPIKSVYMVQICKLFAKALTYSQDLEVGYYATLAMTRLVPYIGYVHRNKISFISFSNYIFECFRSEELRIYQPLVGSVTNYIRRLVEIGAEDKAAEAMEIYDELFESEVTIVLPHIKPIIEMCMIIAGNSSHSDTLRVKSISFMGTLTRLKKKTIVKFKLYIPMINVLFPLMCTIREDTSEDDQDEIDDDLIDEDNSSPTLCSAQTLDWYLISNYFVKCLKKHAIVMHHFFSVWLLTYPLKNTCLR